MVKVELEFDRTVNGLSGAKYGKKVFEEMVKPYYKDYNEDLELVFPHNIERVSYSFVQAFFSPMINTIGVEETKKRIIITSKNKDLENKILERIY